MNEECNRLLDELFDQYYESVFYLCLTVAEFDPGAYQLIEDSIQDAFAKAIICYEVYKDYKNPMGWIARVATNKLRTALGKQKRRAKVTPLCDPEKLWQHRIIPISKATAKVMDKQRKTISNFLTGTT